MGSRLADVTHVDQASPALARTRRSPASSPPQSTAASPMLGPRLSGGTTADIFAYDDSMIVKLFRDTVPANLPIVEARNGQLLNDTGLPIPKCFGAVEIGVRHGIVFERINGKPVTRLLLSKPFSFRRLVRQFAALHRRIHAVRDTRFPALNKRTQRAIEQAPHLAPNQRNRAIDLLRSLPTGASICHWDLNPDNVIVAQRGAFIVDWPDARHGNPLADVARTYVVIAVDRTPIGRPGAPVPGFLRKLFLDAYLHCYFDGLPDAATTGELKRWITVIAAGRLRERLVGEAAPLMDLVERGLSDLERCQH
jgi:uncharacterized protein (TIGR02172 family)